MDRSKCDQLKARLSAQGAIVPIDVFFDGNDDNASIGCYLTNHPGIEAFRTTFLRILGRPDVVAAYAQISEVDPGDEYWPFADMVLVVGTISRDELAEEVDSLEPDEVGSAENFAVPKAIAGQHDAPILVVWWD